MSNGISPVQDQKSNAVNSTQSLSAGRMLREAREAVGLHVGALAVSMKVPVKKLEALEADRLDLLPDAVFVRALASSVCRTLKIDPTLVLEKLPRSQVPQLGPGSRSVNEPFYAHGKSGALSFPGVFSKPSVWWVLVFLVATIAIFFIPNLQKIQIFGAGNADVEDVSPSPLVDADIVASVGPVAMLEPSAALDETSVMPRDAIAESSPPTAATAATQDLVVAESMQEADASKPQDATLGSTSDILELTARGPTWVKVIDAKGVVQVMKILVVGESVRVGGFLPLSVVIGAADSLDVSVRGVPFGLHAVAKDNIARFEVK